MLTTNTQQVHHFLTKNQIYRKRKKTMLRCIVFFAYKVFSFSIGFALHVACSLQHHANVFAKLLLEVVHCVVVANVLNNLANKLDFAGVLALLDDVAQHVAKDTSKVLVASVRKEATTVC